MGAGLGRTKSSHQPQASGRDRPLAGAPRRREGAEEVAFARQL